MADEDLVDDGPEPATDDAPGGQSQQDPDFDRGRAEEKIRKANAEAANLRKRLKELEPLAAKAKDLEDATKSDIERATGEAAAATSRADKAEGELLRLRVAIRKGLTETQAKRLIGTSEEELEADADDLLASFSPKKPDPEPEPEKDDEPDEPARDDRRRRPQERLRPGAVPDADTEPEETDPRKLAALVPRHPTLG